MFEAPNFRAGSHQISAGALNRIAEEVGPPGGTANTISGIEGVHDPARPDPTLARIVGRGDVSGGLPVPYTWLAVTPTSPTAPRRSTPTTPRSGSARPSINPAYEASGNRDVPVDGSVVVAADPRGRRIALHLSGAGRGPGAAQDHRRPRRREVFRR
jgi:hypothetical protein